MKKVVLKAYGKVNLGLDVVRRRDDGYHEVRMIMQTVGLFDRLELKKTSGDSVTLSANFFRSMNRILSVRPLQP